jgi:hypothetical protein
MDQAYTNAANPKRLSSLLHLGHACWIGDGWKTFDLAYSTRDKWIFSSQFTSWTNWTSNDLKPVAKLSFLHPSDDVGSSWGIWSSCFHKNLTTSHDNLQTFEPVVEWDACSAGYFSILSPLLNWRGTLVTLYFVFQPQLGCCWRFWDWSSNRFVPTCTRGTRRHWEKSQFTIQFLLESTRSTSTWIHMDTYGYIWIH